MVSKRKKVKTDKLLEYKEKNNNDEKKIGRPTLAEGDLNEKMKKVARMLAEGTPYAIINKRTNVSKYQIKSWSELPKVIEYGKQHMELVRQRGMKDITVAIRSIIMDIIDNSSDMLIGRKQEIVNENVLAILKKAKEEGLKLSETTAYKIAELTTPTPKDVNDWLKEITVNLGMLGDKDKNLPIETIEKEDGNYDSEYSDEKGLWEDEKE